jgi:hypothetical protein
LIMFNQVFAPENINKTELLELIAILLVSTDKNLVQVLISA